MTNQELVNILEQFPSDAVVKISVLGYVARDVAKLELYKDSDEEGYSNGEMIVELVDDLCDW